MSKFTQSTVLQNGGQSSQITIEPPIYALDTDILTTIFAVNADMFAEDQDALNITRICSQVCRNWRQLLLDSPYLRGKLVDLDESPQTSNRWMEEVLRRSGDALLQIKALTSIEPPPDSRRRFLLSLLSRHWERVQDITVYVILSVDPAIEDPSVAWGMFHRSAPHLRSFEFVGCFRERPTSDPTFSTRPMFANNAPSLRHFQFKGVRFEVPGGRSWFSQLCSLHLGSPMPLTRIVQALQYVGQLEYLYLLVLLTEDHSHLASITPVILPNLKVMDICATMGDSLFFLNHVGTPESCSLKYSVSRISDTELFSNAPTFKLLINRLSNFAARSFSSSRPESLKVDFFHGRSSISNFLDSLERVSSTDQFVFSIPMLCNAVDNNSSILDKFSNLRSCLDDVKELYFKTPQVKLLKEQIVRFLSCLPAVEILHTDGGTLELLMADPSTRKIFPLLRVLKVDIKTPYRKHKLERRTVDNFVHFREQAGFPSLTLDLTL